MSALNLTSLLGGFAEGAGGHIADVNERKRQEQVQNTRLVNEALLSRLKDPDFINNAKPEDVHQVFRTVLKNSGMKDQDIDAIAQHAVGSGILPSKARAQAQGGQPGLGQVPDQGQAPAPAAQGGQGGLGAPPAPKEDYPAFSNPIVDENNQPKGFGDMTLGEQRNYTSALQEYNKRKAQGQEEVAKQGAMTKKQLEIDEQRHQRMLGDMEAANKAGRHVKIGFVNGQERLLPDQGVHEGTVYGGDVDDQDLPENQKNLILRRRRYDNGDVVYSPVTQAKVQVQADQESPTKWSRFVYDGAGNFISKKPIQPPTAYTPTERTGTHEQVIETTDKDGNIIKQVVPLSSTSKSEKKLPGSFATPSTAVPGIPIPRNNGVGGRSLGISPKQTVKEWENKYDTQTVKILEENQPVVQQVDRALKMIDGVKDNNTPFTTLPARGLYSIGMASQYSQLINNLELGKVIGAARVLKGSSRALPALEIAMQHLPNPKTDSPKLMYEKLKNIKQNLSDIEEDAKRFGLKNPNAPFRKNENPTSGVPRRPLSEIIPR